jgi:hypothetical protein
MEPQVMGGKPWIRGMRVTVGTIVGPIAAGKTIEEVLSAYPDLEREDVSRPLLTQPGGQKKKIFQLFLEKILVDMNLSCRWVEVFRAAGWETVHWSEIGKLWIAPQIKLDTHLVVERERQQVSMSKKSSVKRWSAKRKQEGVLRLLQGVSLDVSSRETGHGGGGAVWLAG